MDFFGVCPVTALPSAHTEAMNSFKTLQSAFNSASLIDMLRSPGGHTIHAPTAAAFKRFPSGSLDALFKNARTLEPFLRNHMAGARAANDTGRAN